LLIGSLFGFLYQTTFNLNMSGTQQYTIKDLESFSGIKAHTLRIWEKRYQLIYPERSTTNIRYYSAEQLRELLNISLLNRKGLKISQIAEMSSEARGKLLVDGFISGQKDDLQEAFLFSLTRFDEEKFNETFAVAVKGGFEKAFTKIIFPFFVKIGLLWQSGTICSAQEHFFSGLIRGKLISATADLDLISRTNEQKVILLLPDNELHELGLLFYNYVFRARGYHTLYLGQSVPLNGLQNAISIYRPDVAVVGMAIGEEPKKSCTYLNQLVSWMPATKIFSTGEPPIAELMPVQQLRDFLNLI
jgi:DNA-binding transcriptional MerR regulator